MAQSRSVMSMNETTGHFIDTLQALVIRDFKMRYKGSMLGVTWAVLTPLGTVVILQFLFGKVLGMGADHFPVFLYAGILPWTWFQASLVAGSSTLSDNRDLVRTPFFAKPLLPWAVTCTNFVFYLMALPVMAGLMFYEGLPLSRAMLWMPVVWIVQGILTVGLTLLMSAIGILIRDWQHLVAVLLVFWFYLTPIFYNLDQVPTRWAGWFLLNPMTGIVLAHRAILIDGRAPDWMALAVLGAASVALLVLGFVIFRAFEDSFIDGA